MPTYYVALAVTRPAAVDDEALIRLLHEAAERSACVAFEVTPIGLVIEAEAVSVQMLEGWLRELLGERGAQLDSITITRF